MLKLGIPLFDELLFFSSIVVVDVPPGPVNDLSASPPEGSDSILIITWLPPDEPNWPLEVLYYNVVVTNYSMAPVANMTVPVDQTSAVVMDLGQYNLQTRADQSITCSDRFSSM